LAGTARVVVVVPADPAVERVVGAAVGWVVGTDEGAEDSGAATLVAGLCCGRSDFPSRCPLFRLLAW
jgi:hypothetical protein